DVFHGGHGVGHVEGEAVVEAGDNVVELAHGEAPVPGGEDRTLHELLDQLVLAHLAHRLDLDLAGGGSDQRVEVGDAGHGPALVELDGSLERVSDQVLVVGDRYA